MNIIKSFLRSARHIINTSFLLERKYPKNLKFHIPNNFCVLSLIAHVEEKLGQSLIVQITPAL